MLRTETMSGHITELTFDTSDLSKQQLQCFFVHANLSDYKGEASIGRRVLRTAVAVSVLPLILLFLRRHVIETSVATAGLLAVCARSNLRIAFESARNPPNSQGKLIAIKYIERNNANKKRRHPRMNKDLQKTFLRFDTGPADDHASKSVPNYARDCSFLSASNDADYCGASTSYEIDSGASSPRKNPSSVRFPCPLSVPHSHLPIFSSIATTTRHHGYISAITISGDGVLYTGSESNDMRAWRSLDLQACFGSGSGSVKAILVTATMVFSAHQDRKIRVWSRRDRCQHRHLKTLPTALDRFRRGMNPNNFVRVRRHHRQLWINHADCISCVGFDAENGLLYSGSWDKSVKVWRLRDWKCIESITAHDDAVNSLVVSSDGTLFTASTDGTVKIWAYDSESRSHRLKRVLSTEKVSSVNALALSSNGMFLYGGYASGEVHVWRRNVEETMKHCEILRVHLMATLCLTAVEDIVLSGSADKTLVAWRRDDEGLHSCVAVFRGHLAPVKCIAACFSVEWGGFVIYSGGLDRCVKLWFVEARQRVVGIPQRLPVLFAGTDEARRKL